MNEIITFKPKTSKWIKCEFEINYDCGNNPIIVSDPKCRIIGFRQFGFILSHEYTIPTVFLNGSEQQECSCKNCSRPTRFKVEMRYSMSETIGLGFGLGSGTGTAGWTTAAKPFSHTFHTECICCDNYKEDFRRLSEHPQVIVISHQDRRLSIVLMSFFILVGLYVSFWDASNPIAMVYIFSFFFLASLSLFSTMYRHLAFSRTPDRTDLENRNSIGT